MQMQNSTKRVTPPYTIMHTTSHRQFGGLEKRIYNESCQMAEKGHKIVIAAPDNTPLIVKCRNSFNKDFVCFPIEFTTKSALKDYITLKRIYSDIKPDVLNTHGNMDAKIALTAAWKIYPKNENFIKTTEKSCQIKKDSIIRRILSQHIINRTIPCIIISRHISADVKPSFYNRFLYNSMCDYVFTTADYTTNNLASNLDIAANRIFTIPSGIQPPKELLEPDIAKIDLIKEISALDKGCPINNESRFIGFVGRVSEDKGVISIIEAFSLIANKIPNHHLIFVGQVDNSLQDKETFMKYLNKMVRQGNYENRIHFLGFRENTWKYFRAFDCKILASKEVEGISQSLLEAMYSKCPVAASKVGGTMDIIKNGETGLLFSPTNIKEIANCILEILTDKSRTEEMVNMAFQMVKEKYTIDSMVNRILAIYENCFCSPKAVLILNG